MRHAGQVVRRPSLARNRLAGCCSVEDAPALSRVAVFHLERMLREPAPVLRRLAALLDGGGGGGGGGGGATAAAARPSAAAEMAYRFVDETAPPAPAPKARKVRRQTTRARRRLGLKKGSIGGTGVVTIKRSRSSAELEEWYVAHSVFLGGGVTFGGGGGVTTSARAPRLSGRGGDHVSSGGAGRSGRAARARLVRTGARTRSGGGGTPVRERVRGAAGRRGIV